MKKVLFLILASFLVLAACGTKEESKSEDKKETKSSSKDDKKKNEKKKAKDDKKEKYKVNNNTETESQQTQTVDQQQSTQQPVQQEPTDQEKVEANTKVAKEHGYTGIPNGDASFDVPVGEDAENYSNNDGEYFSNVEPEEPSDWVKGQIEWNNASESERIQIRKADAEKYGYEYDPSDYE
ncbi:hypothetical protein BUZ14_08065 [Staphylococcus gallinarum]|uniref:Lipoprotein n=1 Tax=Staphylococcus gallinarum TaxID=1293 RepID=A0A3A0W1E5_STAGA|nr:hypothetical protein [Staphylococcus gallinarum]RIP33995.1 hypothetical protein BUZ14_08065 [Staphylococcus gallinarum]